GTGRFELTTDIFTNIGGKLYGNGVLALTASQLDNTAGVISSLDDLFVSALGNVNNRSGQIESAAAVQLTANRLDNQQGILLGSGRDAMNVEAVTLDNTAGIIQTNADTLNISTATLDNTQGKILHAGATRAQITAAELTNNAGEIISNASLAINDANISNHAGTLSAVNITVDGENLDNRDGIIDGDTININLAGNLLTDNNAYLAAQSLVDNGLLLTIEGLL